MDGCSRGAMVSTANTEARLSTLIGVVVMKPPMAVRTRTQCLDCWLV
jgi:hypothetical protein